MAQTKTANSFTSDKVLLRAGNLPDGDIKLLDCFAGDGTVWRLVQNVSGRKVTRTAIDTRTDIMRMYLQGDNVKIMQSMDLSRFNVIDVDAYGMPYDQLRLIFESAFYGVIFVTFIQTIHGRLPNKFLHDLGFTDEIINAAPSLIGRDGWRLFLQWLALSGVKKIKHRSAHRKHYLTFNYAGRP